jgi:retron-type reverse transcriptase
LKGKGSHRAALRYQKFSARYRYALKIDIRRYFPSIDHEILKGQLRRRFREEKLHRLLAAIIDQVKVPEPHHSYFRGDDLFAPQSRPKGLPIGNLTSQLFANLYLDDFDHWVKESLGARAYLRFVDDFVLLASSKAQLEDWRERIEQHLAGLRLKIHRSKSVIRRISEGLPFLGYVIWPSRIRIRGEAVRRFRRRMRVVGKNRAEGSPALAQSLAAWGGHVRLAGSYRQLHGMK